MRVLLSTLVLALAACGSPEPEPTPAEQVPAAPPQTDAVAQSPAVLTAADLRRVCRAGLAAVHGQQAAAIAVDGVTGEVVTASWRAPVDGGRMRAECRVSDGLITWRPLDLPDPAEERWMNAPGDPVIRYTLDGDTVSVVQTLPDGASERSEQVVPQDEEAR
jgi:hypothetical protein